MSSVCLPLPSAIISTAKTCRYHGWHRDVTHRPHLSDSALSAAIPVDVTSRFVYHLLTEHQQVILGHSCQRLLIDSIYTQICGPVLICAHPLITSSPSGSTSSPFSDEPAEELPHTETEENTGELAAVQKPQRRAWAPGNEVQLKNPMWIYSQKTWGFLFFI